jgi:two-component system sensor histidine kinase/response regulator
MRLQLIESERGGDDPMHALPRIDPGTSFDVLELVGDRHIERYVTPLHINGNLSGQVFTFREDTDRRRAADALLRLNESLESRILERTQELESATHLAQAASQAKSDFLSNMSHEIRTPMNAVIGLAFLALKTDLNAVQRNYLEKIYHSGRHLLGIINDILDFSKIEAGMLALDESDFKVSVVFDSVSRMTAEAAKAKGLDLAFEIDASLSRSLHGDSLRLGQVLLNYVGNAIKFTTQGGVRVRAMTQQRFKTESLIRFEIEDTGIGLTEAQIGQLFQSFQQADTSTTRNYGGTGLGLALCKQLAELMGGEVGVRSQPGQGSVFWFTCRLRFGAPETSKLQVPTVLPAVGDAREAIHGARILVVDDNLLNQEVTAGLLEDVGAKVTLANHGQAALDQLGAERFDCVLMDVQMPVMDGLQATRLIRENPLFANMPVLAMTANARSEDRARCAESGMNDFLTKPVMPDRLYATLAYWLTHSPAVTAAGSGSDSAPPEQAAAVPGGDPGIIDLSILSQQVGGDPQKIRRYAMLFVEAIPESMAELETALEQGDVSALADLGHRMKSSSRMVGALGLASLCETLEALRQSGSLDEICHIVGEIRLVLARISADIAVALQE